MNTGMSGAANRYVWRGEVGDDTVTAGLSFAATGEPDFPGAACTGHEHAGRRIRGDEIHHRESLLLGHSGRSGVAEKGRCFDDRVHRPYTA
jgi:hypothetical protein